MRTKRFAKVVLPVLGFALYGCGGADQDGMAASAGQGLTLNAPGERAAGQMAENTTQVRASNGQYLGGRVFVSDLIQDRADVARPTTDLGAVGSSTPLVPVGSTQVLVPGQRPTEAMVDVAAEFEASDGRLKRDRGGLGGLWQGFRSPPLAGPAPRPEPMLPEQEQPLNGGDFVSLGSLLNANQFNFDRVTGVSFPGQGLALKVAPLVVPQPYESGLTGVGAVFLPYASADVERGSYLVALDLTTVGDVVSGHLFDAEGQEVTNLTFTRELLDISSERTQFLGQVANSQHLMPGRLDVDASANPEQVCFVLAGTAHLERYCSEQGSVLAPKNVLPQGFAYAQELLREGTERLLAAGLFEALDVDYAKVSSRVEAPMNVESCNQQASCNADLVRAPVLQAGPYDSENPRPVELVLVLRDFTLGQVTLEPGMYTVYNVFEGDQFIGSKLVGQTVYGQRLIDFQVPAVPAPYVPANSQTVPDATAPRCTFWDSSCQPQ